MFLPTTREELEQLGWDKLDVIIVTGDTYIDSPHIGVAVIGKMLVANGFKVGIIAQPDFTNATDITRLGEPALFWGVTAGSIDSMIANHTALLKPRRSDDFTPGGLNNKRPNRASVVYANIIRQYFKHTVPIVLGGVEASLRRIAHYDYWEDKVRRSILFDAKADILVYGMGEKATLELALALQQKNDIKNIKGICYISPVPPADYIKLPSYEEVKNDKPKFVEMFHQFYQNTDPVTASGLCQQQDNRYLVQNPPQANLYQFELDQIYDFDYERDVHPYYKKAGEVKALETIKFSVTTHRGCYGGCNFCGITVHQGSTIISRSKKSILNEIEKITKIPGFKGYISDVGGPTANMYGIECEKKFKQGQCKNKDCIYPVKCESLKIDHQPQIELLDEIRKIKGIKKAFVASGIRYDMVFWDEVNGMKYLEQIVEHHTSGQLKIAPEHTAPAILKYMRKPGTEYLTKFKSEFDRLTRLVNKKQFLTYYFIAAHPGCKVADMKNLRFFVTETLRLTPEQVQIFTPIPSTYSALMYYTEIDPFTGEKMFVEKNIKNKIVQKEVFR